MRPRSLFAASVPLALAASFLASPSVAQVADEGAEQGRVVRYQLERTENGYARIDTATGEVSSCTERGDQLVCRMAADERTALMEEVAALERRVEALEKGGIDRALPSEEDVDRAVGLVERMMRGLMGIAPEEGTGN